MRQGATKWEVDQAGADLYFHAPPDYSPITGREVSSPPSTEPPIRADADVLNQVYTVLLSALPYTVDLAKHLKERLRLTESEGASPKLTRLGYRVLNQHRLNGVQRVIREGLEKHLPSVPGFYVKTTDDGRRMWSLAGANGFVIPVRDFAGRIVALRIRLHNPPVGGSRYRWLSSKKKGGPGPGTPVHVPRFEGDRGTVRITEGEIKADVATLVSGVLTISLPGVGSYRRAAQVLQQLGATTARIAFDADCRSNSTVAHALSGLVEHLEHHEIAVELETWDAADGKGIDDVLVAGKQPTVVQGEAVPAAIAAILQEAQAGEPPTPTSSSAGDLGPDERRIQFNRRQLRNVTAQAYRCLLSQNEPPTIFQRAGLLTRLRDRDGRGTFTLETLSDAALRGVLARVADWYQVRETKNGAIEEDDAPPTEVVQDLASQPSWLGLPHIDAIVESPVFDRNARLLLTPGFHTDARLWLQLAPGFGVPPIPEQPTVGEIRTSRDLLLVDLLGDFPFKDQASKAHALAALLLPLVRPLMDGPTPLHLFDAPIEGTGKGLLIAVLTMIATGHLPAVMSEGTCDEEWRKRITALLIEGPTFILLDNLNRLLDSGALAAALTTTVWRDRILGVSKTATLPNRSVWLASGNNTRLSRELIRRTLWCRLDANVDAPWERTGFRHPNLARWAQDHRGQLLAAALTLIQAWVVAGRPAGKTTLGSFEAWAEVIGGILEVAEIPGLLTNAKDFRSTHADKVSEWRAFIAAWWQEFQDRSVGVDNLFQLVSREKLLDSEIGDGNERSQRIRLGKALGRSADRVFGEHRLERGGEDHSRRQQYRLCRVGETVPVVQGTEEEVQWEA